MFTAGRRRRTRGRTPAAVNADNSIGQLKGSFELSANLTDVRLSTPQLSGCTATAIDADNPGWQVASTCHLRANQADVLVSAPDMSGDAALAQVRPSTIRELNGVPLVRTGETLTVSAVGAEGEPERVLTSAVIHIGRDLGTTSLPVGENALKTVGEHFRAVGAENNDRRELSAVGQRLHVLVDDVVVNGRADLSSRIGYETVQREDLTDRAADRRIRRQPRRRTRSRYDGRHGKKQPTGSLPASPWQRRTKRRKQRARERTPKPRSQAASWGLRRTAKLASPASTGSSPNSTCSTTCTVSVRAKRDSGSN